MDDTENDEGDIQEYILSILDTELMCLGTWHGTEE